MLRVRWLGRVPYGEALALQRGLARWSADDYLLLLEHPHVYTLGVRADRAHVLVDPARVGAELVTTDRGGDVTYHGPGQLVVYPIVTLPDGPGAGPAHVHELEETVIEALEELGLGEACDGVGRLDRYPGVWLGTGGPRPRKVAAVGVRTVRAQDGRRRSLHGVALNVSCDLGMFAHIVPCGIRDLPVTSLAAEGRRAPMADVVDVLVGRAALRWGGGGVVSGPAGPGVDRQDVAGARQAPAGEAGAAVADPDPAPAAPRASTRVHVELRSAGAPAERPLLRRLRQAGVDPDAGLPVATRKPEWLRVRARMGADYLSLGRTIRDLGLVTVCEEAGCPNIYECWADGTATFMVNGARCTRACGFCLVDTRRPLPLDPSEPERVAEAVARMDLAHAVVTCVARDDLVDGGAAAVAATVSAIRRRRPHTAVEVLISDCKGDASSLSQIFDARPDVLNHNIETVARLQRAVRPSAGYARSLAVLARAAGEGLKVKSGLMVGLGESRGEVLSTLADLRGAGVAIATIGQYLRPSRHHLPVSRWWSPDEFADLAREGRALGLAHVEASPLTRSSYHARSAAESADGPTAAGDGGIGPSRTTAVVAGQAG